MNGSESGPSQLLQQPLLCLREVLGVEAAGNSGSGGSSIVFRRSVFSAETGSLTPGHSQADKATHSWAGLCWPLFLSVKQLRETQSDPEAEPSGFPLNQPSPIHSPAAWVLVECTPCLQNLGLTGGRASHVLLYPQLMVLDRWSERRWLCLRMNGFQVSYT